MIADFPQLHQNIHHPHKISTLLQSHPCGRSRQKFFVQSHLGRYSRCGLRSEITSIARFKKKKTYLAPRKLTFDNVFKFPWHLGLHILFQPTKYKWTYDTMKPFDDIIISIGTAFDDVIHRVRKPVRELFTRAENVWHQKV